MNANPAGSDLVIGAGVIGSRVARMLAEGGHRFSVVSRRGAGPAGGTHPAGVTHLAADAADADAMARLAEGAAVILSPGLDLRCVTSLIQTPGWAAVER